MRRVVVESCVGLKGGQGMRMKDEAGYKLETKDAKKTRSQKEFPLPSLNEFAFSHTRA